MKSTPALLLLTLLLPACASGRPVVINECIPLEPPPVSVVDALESVAHKDADAAHWVIVLEKHYQAIEACMSAR